MCKFNRKETMKLISNRSQKTLIVKSALKKKSRLQLSKEIGISEFTLRKVLDSESPIKVNNKTADSIENWLKNND